jgi:hypothetical protein
VPVRAAAQDAHYWTQQYGNQARLLGGAVIGSASDVSAVYYNPGRLALVDDAQLVLAGNVFEYSRLKISDLVAEGATITSSQLGGVPSLFAGQIRSSESSKNRFAYSFLPRHSSSLRLNERRDVSAAVDYPVELLTSAVTFDEKMSEYWGGATWAHALSPHVGLGISGFISVRSFRNSSLLLVQAADGADGGVALRRRDYDYNTWGVLAKIGLGFDLGAWQAGVTITTPVLQLFGSGSLGFDESVVSTDLDGDGSTTARIATGFQQGLDASTHSPFAMGGGVSYRWGATVLHVSSEWFDKVDQYDVLAGEPVASTDSSVVRETTLVDRRGAVLNVGVGLEHEFREHLKGYVSFRTDHSSSERAAQLLSTYGTWDIHHFSAGLTFVLLNAEFTVGGIYATGSDNVPIEGGLLPEEGDDPGTAPQVKAEFRRLTGILGFSFGL